MIVDVTCNDFLDTMSQMRNYVTTLNYVIAAHLRIVSMLHLDVDQEV